jgi:hypothetical protein
MEFKLKSVVPVDAAKSYEFWRQVGIPGESSQKLKYFGLVAFIEQAIGDESLVHAVPVFLGDLPRTPEDLVKNYQNARSTVEKLQDDRDDLAEARGDKPPQRWLEYTRINGAITETGLKPKP